MKKDLMKYRIVLGRIYVNQSGIHNEWTLML